jgi:hypothetical protein
LSGIVRRVQGISRSFWEFLGITGVKQNFRKFKKKKQIFRNFRSKKEISGVSI